MVINAEHFQALRLLLDDPSLPKPPVPAWPGALPAGEYACDAAPGPSGAIQHAVLSLFQRSGRPCLSTDGATGTVRQTLHTPFQGLECWQWDIDWDDGSGTLRCERLWLHARNGQRFDLYDAQGQCTTYTLVAEEVIAQRCLWPEPLCMAVYQATDTAHLPSHLHQIEILEYDDQPLLQCGIGCCTVNDAQTDADGIYHAMLEWSLHQDVGNVLAPTQIRWHIHDGDRFDWLHADGSATPFTWLRNI